MNKYKITVGGAGLNEYIQGRISGIVHVLSGMPAKGYGWMRHDDDGRETLTFECTEEQYQTIVTSVKNLYGHLIDLEF